MFKKLLIANRGEIARRIIAAAKGMQIATVAVYSDADQQLPFVREADEAVRIGPPPPKSSYLDTAAILSAARHTGAQAIHPGYGFLSESAEFAIACATEGLIFVGPPPDSLARMKDKSGARRIAKEAGVPVVPGSEDVLPSLSAAVEEAERLGYPVLCKAAAGGGGIGMAVASDRAELEKAFRQCTDRALSAFGRPGVYLERYFRSPRHIEVQILGDARGHLIHGLERECSIQRRHQKVVEEAPSPLFSDPERRPLAGELFAAALRAAKAFQYSNAGTAEFLYADEAFYFIEMNARLQVEHPITELTTGLDLIGWQLRIAAGEELTVRQEEVHRRGAAIEFRIYAEDPIRFLPSPGRITAFVPPQGEGVRLDAGYEEGNTVTPYYDPLIAKLIVSGADRAQVLERSESALRSFRIEGIKTNLPLHLRIVQDPGFRSGQISTAFLDRSKP
jgi:acetyl-CoA carboxylase biotin carboxylase subunit